MGSGDRRRVALKVMSSWWPSRTSQWRFLVGSVKCGAGIQDSRPSQRQGLSMVTFPEWSLLDLLGTEATELRFRDTLAQESEKKTVWEGDHR